MEPTNKEIIYCQKVLHLLDDLQKVRQSIEFFFENSDKQRIRTHQGQSLILKSVFFLIIVGVRIFFKLSIFLLIIISLVYLLIFGLLLRYDSKKSKEKLALDNNSTGKLKALSSDLNKLKEKK